MKLEELSTAEKQRVEEAYKQLLCFNPTGKPLKLGQEWIPAWSSYGLEQLIEQTLSTRGGRIRDLYLGFWKVLEETHVPLTKVLSYLIEKLIIYSVLNYRRRFKKEDYKLFKREEIEWMVPLVIKGCTQAQAYLAVSILPAKLAKDCKDSILSTLENTDYIEEAKSMLSHCFNMQVSLEQRLEKIFEDVKLKNNKGKVVDWEDLSSIYHAITYCIDSQTLKDAWLKNILSLDLTPKAIEEAAKDAIDKFERIIRIISNNLCLNDDEWELVLSLRLELEIIKDFFHFKKVDFPPLELANLCEEMKRNSQTQENKKNFAIAVSQLNTNPPLPFVDIWFQAVPSGSRLAKAGSDTILNVKRHFEASQG